MNLSMRMHPVVFAAITFAAPLACQEPAEAPDRLEPLTFGWKIPSEAVVTDFVEKDGNSSKLRFVLRATQDATDEDLIRVQLRDFQFLEYNGVDATTPEMKERLAPAIALTSAVPDFLVDAEGTYVDCEGMDELMKRVTKLLFEARGVSEEEARQVQQMMAQPQVQQTIVASVGQYWMSWSGAFVGWDLPIGKEETGEIEVEAFGALIPMKQTMKNLGAVKDQPALRRLRIETLGEGKPMLDAMLDMLEGMGGVRPPEGAITEVKSTNSIEAEIDPSTLRPRRVVTVKDILIKGADSPDGQRRLERHDYRFEWKTPKPTDKGK